MGMRRLMEAQADEMLRDKWIQSEKAGYDLGEACMLKWVKEHAAEFRHAYNLDHMERLDDGTPVESVCIYPSMESIGMMADAYAMPDGWTETDCRFCIPDSAKEMVADRLGCDVRIMVAMIGYSDDGIYAAGVLEGVPVSCIAKISCGGSNDCSSDVKWIPMNICSPIVGVLDTFPRQQD